MTSVKTNGCKGFIVYLICEQDAIPKKSVSTTNRTFLILNKWTLEQPPKSHPSQPATFRADCRVFVVNVILKLVEKTPMRYSFVGSSTCLAPKNIANNKKSASLQMGCLILTLS